MFSKFVVSSIAKGARAFWVPRNQPTRAKLARAAGRPNRRVWKKSWVVCSRAADGCIRLNAA
ncbi:hypothetical protein D3C81_2178160 [compost metagenome]